MIYDREKITNEQLIDYVQECLTEGVIGSAHSEAVETMRGQLYERNNFALRFGLFAFTMLLCICASGLVALLLGFYNNTFMGALWLIISGGLSVMAARHFIKNKMHYKSGIDSGLYWFASACVAIGICLMLQLALNNHLPNASYAIVACVVCGIAAYYFYDTILLMLMWHFVANVFHLFMDSPSITVKFFLCMAFTIVSIITYVLYMRTYYARQFIHIKMNNALGFIMCLYVYASWHIAYQQQFGLLTTLGSNTWVVAILHGWCWLLPLCYTICGLSLHKRFMVLAGLVCMVLHFLWLPIYYVNILPETLLLVAAAYMFACVILAHLFFKSHKWGITTSRSKYDTQLLPTSLQWLVSTQMNTVVSSAATQPTSNVKMEEGKFGGGGANADY